MKTKTQVQNVLDLIFFLSPGNRRKIDEIERRYEVSKRTAERYISELRKVGIQVFQSNGYYEIDKYNGLGKNLSDLFYFTEEEEYILSKAIQAIDNSNIIKSELIAKLYSLYDTGIIDKPLLRIGNSENVHALLSGMQNKKQILLRGYKSANSGIIRDRLVEPIRFNSGFISFWAYDPENRENRLFKTSRINKAELMTADWRFETYHKPGKMDVFRMSGKNKTKVTLKMNLRACNLLCEEYPLAEKKIRKKEDCWYFIDEVHGFEGVGRFVMGLPGEVEVVAPVELKEFVLEKMKCFFNQEISIKNDR